MFPVFYRTVQAVLRPIHGALIILLIKTVIWEYIFYAIPLPPSDHRSKNLDWEAPSILEELGF